MQAGYFFKGLSWLLVLNLLVKPVWIFGIDRQVQNIVGHEVYGTYFALLNLCYVLLFVGDAGLSSMLTQKLASDQQLHVRQLLRLKFMLLLFYTGVCIGIALLTGIRQWAVLLYLILIQSLISLFVFLRSLLTARQYFRTDAVFSVLDKFLLLLLCIGPVYGFYQRMTILLFLQLQVVSIAAAVVTLLFFLAKEKAFTAGNNLHIKTIIKWTAPFVLIILLMSAHNRLDAFLLERLHADGAREAGIYAMAYRLLDAANVAGFMTGSFLLPFLSRHRNDRILLQKVVLLSRHGLLFIAIGVVTFIFAFAPWLLQVLYYSTDGYSSTVMQLCLLALPAYYLIHVYGSVLTATAQFRLFIRIMALAALLNTILNFVLIPSYGALGCCVAALITQYGCGLCLWLAASRKLSISPSFGTALLYPITAALLFFSFHFGQKLTGNVWIILASIVLVTTVILISQRSLIRKVFFSLYK